MEVKKVAIVLADISGYTHFAMHTMSRLHAEKIITELLESIIESADHRLILSKLEGDAVFMYAESDGDEAETAKDVLRQVLKFSEAYSKTSKKLVAENTCRCEGCDSIGELKLKTFLHYGQVIIKRIKQFEELAGEDVILAHRLMKNSLLAKEYIMMAQKFYELSGGLQGQTYEVRKEYYDDIGEVNVLVYYRKNVEQQAINESN